MVEVPTWLAERLELPLCGLQQLRWLGGAPAPKDAGSMTLLHSTGRTRHDNTILNVVK